MTLLDKNQIAPNYLVIQSSKRILISSHFVNTTGDWASNSAGSGATTGVGVVGISDSNSGNKVGIGSLRSGTAAAGQVRFGISNSASFRLILIGQQAWLYECVGQTIVLSDATNTYYWVAGFTDAGNVVPGNGIYFRYSSINSPNFECVCSRNGTNTIVNSNVVVNANQWYKLTIAVNKAGTITTFTIDDVLVATITANIPLLGVAPIFGMFNTLGTAATRGLNVDYLECIGQY